VSILSWKSICQDPGSKPVLKCLTDINVAIMKHRNFICDGWLISHSANKFNFKALISHQGTLKALLVSWPYYTAQRMLGLVICSGFVEM
jgi:hypothetical protein